MAQVEILSETERDGGWTFAVQVLDESGRLHPMQITLSWADYNLWSADGSDAPASVMDAVFAFLLQRLHAHELPVKFDASWARRKFADADALIPPLIR